MPPRIFLAALLLAAAPLAGVADDSSSDNSDVAVERNSDNRSEKTKRDSSDIMLTKEERLANRQEQRRSYDDYVRDRGKDGGEGGRNPSPDD